MIPPQFPGQVADMIMQSPATSSAPNNAAGQRPASIARDLAKLRRLGRDRPVTLAEAAELFAERSALLLLLFLGLLGLMPSPGLPLGFLTGSLIVAIAGGMLLALLLRRDHGQALLPGMLARRELSSGFLDRFLRYMIPRLRWVERHFRPRLTWMLGGLGLALALLGIMIQAIGLALPIPFANAPFAVGIILIALGLLTRDGLGVLAGQTLGLISTGICVGLGLAAWRAGTGIADLLPW